MRPVAVSDWPPVGLGFWFSASADLAAAVCSVVALLAAVSVLVARRRARRIGLVVAGFAFAGAWAAIAGGPALSEPSTSRQGCLGGSPMGLFGPPHPKLRRP